MIHCYREFFHSNFFWHHLFQTIFLTGIFIGIQRELKDLGEELREYSESFISEEIV